MQDFPGTEAAPSYLAASATTKALLAAVCKAFRARQRMCKGARLVQHTKITLCTSLLGVAESWTEVKCHKLVFSACGQHVACLLALISPCHGDMSGVVTFNMAESSRQQACILGQWDILDICWAPHAPEPSILSRRGRSGVDPQLAAACVIDGRSGIALSQLRPEESSLLQGLLGTQWKPSAQYAWSSAADRLLITQLRSQSMQGSMTVFDLWQKAPAAQCSVSVHLFCDDGKPAIWHPSKQGLVFSSSVQLQASPSYTWPLPALGRLPEHHVFMHFPGMGFSPDGQRLLVRVLEQVEQQASAHDSNHPDLVPDSHWALNAEFAEPVNFCVLQCRTEGALLVCSPMHDFSAYSCQWAPCSTKVVVGLHYETESC